MDHPERETQATMSEDKIYPVAEDAGKKAWADQATYEKLYEASVKDPEAFWQEQAQRIEWVSAFSEVKDISFQAENLHIRWFADGELNVSVNCLDRHLLERGDQIAIIWEGDDPKENTHISYRQLHERVPRFGNALRTLGVKKGDRVTIYLPMIPEAAVAMLACARIGAIHSVVFGGFSPEALRGRIEDCKSNVVITSDEGIRGGKKNPSENERRFCHQWAAKHACGHRICSQAYGRINRLGG